MHLASRRRQAAPHNELVVASCSSLVRVSAASGDVDNCWSESAHDAVH